MWQQKKITQHCVCVCVCVCFNRHQNKGNANVPVDLVKKHTNPNYI